MSNFSMTAVLLMMLSGFVSAEDYFYHITLRTVDDGKGERYYVKTNIPPGEMLLAMEKNKVVEFTETYAYMLASDKFETINKWNDLMSGRMLVGGEDIIVLQILVANPELFESKNRVFRKSPENKNTQGQQ